MKKLGWPLTLNVVLHRHNIDRIGRILDLAADLEPTGSNWPTRSTTAGLGGTGTPCCRAGLSSSAPRPWSARRASGCGAGWRSSTSSPTTTADTPNPAWAAGAGGSSPWCPTATCCPARPHTTFRSPRQRARALAGMDLGAVPPLPALPRNGLDAGAMPELRPPRPRLRRLPLPGIPAHRRRRPHRPCLSPLPRPRDRRRRGAGRQSRLRHPGRPPPRRRRAPSSFPGRSRVPGRSLAPVRHDGPRYPWRPAPGHRVGSTEAPHAGRRP